MSLPLAVIERPGGKPYRARKQPEAFYWHGEDSGYDDRYGVTVMRTHDIDRATALARRLFDNYVGNADEYPLPDPELVWFRFTPWGCETVPAHIRGAVPCVYFEVIER